MAGSLRTHTAQLTPDTWTKVMGQGIRELTADHQYTVTLQLTNASGGDVSALVAFVDGNTAPASDTALGVHPVEMGAGRKQAATQLAMETGWTVWVKASAQIEVLAMAQCFLVAA